MQHNPIISYMVRNRVCDMLHWHRRDTGQLYHSLKNLSGLPHIPNLRICNLVVWTRNRLVFEGPSQGLHDDIYRERLRKKYNRVNVHKQAIFFYCWMKGWRFGSRTATKIFLTNTKQPICDSSSGASNLKINNEPTFWEMYLFVPNFDIFFNVRH